MEREPDAFVSGALAIVLQVSRVAGLAPLRFVKQRGGWRVSLSRGLYVYGCVLLSLMNLVIFVAVVFDSLMEPSQSIRMQSSTRRIVWILDVAIMMSLVFDGAYAAPKHLRAMIECMNRLQKINNELNVSNWSKKKEIKVYIILSAFTLLTLFVTSTDHLPQLIAIRIINHKEVVGLMYLCYYVCYWIMQLLIYQFILIVLHIRRSFAAVNNKLRVLAQEMLGYVEPPFRTPMTQRVSSMNKKRKKSVNTIIDSLAFVKVKPVDQYPGPVHEKVHRLSLIYLSICDVARKIDKEYSMLVVLLLGSFLLHMTITPYYLINNVSTNRDDRGTIYILSQCIWCIYHFGCLVMVIEPCHLTLQEVAVTREQISVLMRHTSSPNDPLAIELDLFFRQLILNQVSYSPFQITTLTRGLVATILSTIVTYLVVIIQL